MADIIAFPARRTPGVAAATPTNQRPVEILFFTGVRIERHVDEAAPARDAAKRSALTPERSTPRRRRS